MYSLTRNRYKAAWCRGTVTDQKPQGTTCLTPTLPMGMLPPPHFFYYFMCCNPKQYDSKTSYPYLIKTNEIFTLNRKKVIEWSLKCACHSAAFSGTEGSLKGH